MDTLPQLIIDTDMSFDDLMAIVYLLNRQDIEIIGITVTGAGVCHRIQGAKNALRLLRLAGKDAKGIPVACGDEQPIDGFNSYPDPWRVSADTLYGATLPDSSEQPDDRHAVDVLISLLTQADRPVTILCIGPLTNIAEAIERDPIIHSKIEQFVIMAGALHVKGHVVVPGFTDNLKNEVTDWNSYVDPFALQKVFKFGVPITLVPLDATNKLPLTLEFTKLFREKAKTPESRFLEAVFEHEMDFIKFGIYYFWDPMAASAIVDRDILRLENQKLDVVVAYSDNDMLGNTLGFSATCKDGNPRRAFDLYRSGQIIESDTGQWVEVCTGVDAAAYYQRFIQVINQEFHK
jgi:inosine-uridine nucleoside N-ribohydrolase